MHVAEHSLQLDIHPLHDPSWASQDQSQPSRTSCTSGVLDISHDVDTMWPWSKNPLHKKFFGFLDFFDFCVLAISAHFMPIQGPRPSPLSPERVFLRIGTKYEAGTNKFRSFLTPKPSRTDTRPTRDSDTKSFRTLLWMATTQNCQLM